MRDPGKEPIKYAKTRNPKEISAYRKQKKILQQSTSGMHTKRLVQ